jgi:hypothetical protein
MRIHREGRGQREKRIYTMREIFDPMALQELDRLSGDLEAFQGELMLEFYNNYAGLKDDFTTAAIYDRYQHLFSQETMDQLSAGPLDEGDPEELRRTRYMRAFATMGRLDSAVKDLTDKASTFETTSIVGVDGEDVPYRAVPVRLRNEADPERRRRLFEAKLVHTLKLNEVLLARIGTLHDMAATLGFKSYVHLCSELKGIDYISFADEMEDLLRRTEGIYLSSMEELVSGRTGKTLSDAWSYDIPFAFRGSEFDGHFDAAGLIGAFKETLEGMGLDPSARPNIVVDTEDRPKKTPRAFCAPVKVPDDVRLVIKPTGGWRDYEALFHEGGHAWHFGNADRAMPAEYRYLGDNSVTEAFAFLFNYLPTNPLWLESRLGMEDPDEYVRFALTNKLMFLRRYASKMLYELKLHNSTVNEEFGEVYRGCLQRGLRFGHTDLHYLEDVDDALYCVDYLRAWIFEGQLRQALEEKFTEMWFEDPKAGEYLTELWSYGQKFTAEECAKLLGYVDLDSEALITEIERGLGQ